MFAADAEGTAPHRLVLEFVPVSLSAYEAAARPPKPVLRAKPAAPAGPVPLPKLKPAPKPVRHLIAIDAGHGGRDPGAIATNGLREKTLALAFARELRTVLVESGRYQAVMTRDGDRKIRLKRRVVIARQCRCRSLPLHPSRPFGEPRRARCFGPTRSPTRRPTWRPPNWRHARTRPISLPTSILPMVTTKHVAKVLISLGPTEHDELLGSARGNAVAGARARSADYQAPAPVRRFSRSQGAGHPFGAGRARISLEPTMMRSG